MDQIDKQILRLLQQDTTLSTAAIADKVGLSPTPCWRRVQNMEKAGIIRARVALLDRDKLNLGIDVFVTIQTNQHNNDWLEHFKGVIQNLDEVVECYRMSGDVDYMLRVVVRDIAAYDQFYKRLIRHTEITNVSSSFAMERMKYTTELPLD